MIDVLKEAQKVQFPHADSKGNWNPLAKIQMLDFLTEKDRLTGPPVT